MTTCFRPAPYLSQPHCPGRLNRRRKEQPEAKARCASQRSNSNRQRRVYQADQKLPLLGSFGDAIDTNDNNNHSSRNIQPDLRSTRPRVSSGCLKKETRRDPSGTAATQHEHSTHCTSTTNANNGDDGDRWTKWVERFRDGFTTGQGPMYIVGLLELSSRAPPLS